MKQITKLTIVGILTLLVFTACNASWNGVKGNGYKTTETRNVSSFDGIEVAGSYDVQLVKGKEGEITIDAEENLIEYIITEVENNTLHIYTKDGYSINSRKGIHIKVNVNTIASARLAGSGSITSNETYATNMFTTSVTGSGDIYFKINAKKTEATVTGSGDLELEGTTEEFRADITGSGDIQAYRLTSSDAKVTISGSGGVELYCKQSLKANITGSGDINYKGNPVTRELNTAGSGNITKVN
ncbi:DUF2807 domain-containing protein [Neptunitalea chrysea]|uniref:DUF2807 domain-containing protein n=1 Tax=Neptunitalea chrysea TaxID=1647581 RepID=A0A9W6B359_9FLAO|nr:head GIN domain-containing protein [Neptunitalea chrysea]GLB51648.1 DUF2807 domain-containing protein [Neptunitalea chrysea]